MLKKDRREYLIAKLEDSSHAGLMTTAELAEALNCGRTKAREYTYGLAKYVGCRYLVPDIADAILAQESY